MKTAPHFRYFAFLAIVVMLYSIRLSADAPAFMPTDDLADGAWWADPARDIVLFNDATVGGFAGALAVGPLSVAWHYLSFSMFGISLWSLRLFSLLPALAALIILKHRKGYAAALLLAACPWWFASARSALPEVMQGLLLLLAFEMQQKNTAKHAFAAGAMVVVASLLKVSLVYLLPVLLLIPMMQQRYRTVAYSLAGMVLVGGLAWGCWFWPHASEFAPFYRAFASDYYQWKQLLDPTGIAARWVFLDSKFLLQNPWMAAAFLMLLWECGQAERISIYRLAWLFGFMLLLGSDMQNRRFIPLLPLLPLALLPGGVEVGMSRAVRMLILTGLVWLLLGLCGLGHAWFIWDGAYFQLKGYAVLALLGIPAGLLLLFRNRSHLLLLHRLLVVGIMGAWAVHTGMGWEVGLVLGVWFMAFYLDRTRSWNLLIAGGGCLIVWAQIHPQHQLREVLQHVSKELPANVYVAGNSGSFLLCLESRAKVLHYPFDTSHHLQVHTLAYISSMDQKLPEIKDDALHLAGRYGGRSVNYRYWPLWHHRETALLVYVLPFP
jgi:hypothetical protein